MSAYRKYEIGNLVHYSPDTFPHKVCQVVRVGDKILEIKDIRSDQLFEVDNIEGKIGGFHPIWLDQKAFTRLGFKDFQNHELKRVTLRNDLLELISTGEIYYEEARKVYGFKGFQVRNRLNDEYIMTIGNDNYHLRYVHELQNLYSSQLRRALDVSQLSDIPR